MKLLFLLALLSATGVLAQQDTPLVSTARLDAVADQISAERPEDDPLRATLLDAYSNIRATLAEIDGYRQSLQDYSRARASASAEAKAIQVGLAERELGGDQPRVALATVPLEELEQAIQVKGAELEARRGRLADIGSIINDTSARTVAIRERLTTLGGEIPELASQLSLMPADVKEGGQEEAELWLLQARLASARAQKASLNEELLSQPMRLELLKAQQDRATQDIALLERRLQGMERRAGQLRKGAVDQARADAEMAVADTFGKHPLLQELASSNAQMTASFAQRSGGIEEARKRDALVKGQAEQLDTDLKAIERKLDLLGMNLSVGQILREQQLQLPNKRLSTKEIEAVSERITSSSLHQIELEDERRQLSSAREYIERLVEHQKPPVAEDVLDELHELALTRRDLVEQALSLEGTYAVTLGSLDFSLHDYARVVSDYRQFISERLLWMPSRNPFSLFREGILKTQLSEMFVLERWARVFRQIPQELKSQPVISMGLVLALILFATGSRLRAQLIARGREVGYVRTDLFANTLFALGLSGLLALRWALVLLVLGLLFQVQDTESELSTALARTLVRGGVYLWVLEFIRLMLIPKGLVEAHFRWPPRRTAALHRRILRLEQVFFPAALTGTLFVMLYPREVGGPLGAISTIIVLLSLAHFFWRLPHFLQDKVEMMLVDGTSRTSASLGGFLRRLLIWLPLLGVPAVLLGYTYTVDQFTLLLVKTISMACLILLFHEMGLRWLRMTRRRMVVRVRAELEQVAGDDSDSRHEEEDALENDPELLNDEGTKLLNVLTMLISLAGFALIWAGVFPALTVLDSVELWHQTGVVDGREVPVPVTLGRVLGALLVGVIGWLALRRIPGLLEIFLRQKMGVRPASAYAATRVAVYAATGALILVVLSSLGGSWSQIQWAVAALSVGIGFGLQEIVANFISGLIILFEQPVRVGDTVTVGNVSGRVTKIRIRATTIRDFDNRELLVPNKDFITQQLLNWSLSDQVTRWVLEVGVAYGTDLDKAMGLVREAVDEHPEVLADPPPIVTFEQFGDSSLVIKARFFLEQLDQRLRVASEVRLGISRRFNEHGIVVSFPQRDIHLDTSEPLEVRMVQQGADRPHGQ